MGDRAKLPKWAREEIEAIEEQLELANAKKWTDRVSHDVEPPKSMSYGLTYGYSFNAPSHRLFRSVSSSTGHADYDMDHDGPMTTRTQCAKWLYSTPLLAARALRQKMERDFLKKLVIVDRMIKEYEEAEASNVSGESIG